jgi:hypothetical protein
MMTDRIHALALAQDLFLDDPPLVILDHRIAISMDIVVIILGRRCPDGVLEGRLRLCRHPLLLGDSGLDRLHQDDSVEVDHLELSTMRVESM